MSNDRVVWSSVKPKGPVTSVAGSGDRGPRSNIPRKCRGLCAEYRTSRGGGGGGRKLEQVQDAVEELGVPHADTAIGILGLAKLAVCRNKLGLHLDVVPAICIASRMKL